MENCAWGFKNLEEKAVQGYSSTSNDLVLIPIVYFALLHDDFMSSIA